MTADWQRGVAVVSADVDAALGFVAAAPAAFATATRESAGGAANGRVALVVQRIVRQVVFADVIPDFGFAVVSERVGFVEAARVVELDFGCVLARGRVLATQTRDPTVEAAECGVQRVDFVGAAAVARAPRLFGAGIENFDAHIVVSFEFLPRLISFGEENAGVDSEDASSGFELE